MQRQLKLIVTVAVAASQISPRDSDTSMLESVMKIAMHAICIGKRILYLPRASLTI